MVAVTSTRDDLVRLSNHAFGRLWDRVRGLTDDELTWEPAPGVTTAAWRLGHLARLLTERRVGDWLGQPAPAPVELPDSADGALAAVRTAHDRWRQVLAATTDESLAEPIGRGRYAAATRRGFALHILDELIHHAAEVALVRDLYAATHPAT